MGGLGRTIRTLPPPSGHDAGVYAACERPLFVCAHQPEGRRQHQPQNTHTTSNTCGPNGLPISCRPATQNGQKRPDSRAAGGQLDGRVGPHDSDATARHPATVMGVCGLRLPIIRVRPPTGGAAPTPTPKMHTTSNTCGPNACGKPPADGLDGLFPSAPSKNSHDGPKTPRFRQVGLSAMFGGGVMDHHAGRYARPHLSVRCPPTDGHQLGRPTWASARGRHRRCPTATTAAPDGPPP